jgi:EAL domain-containing protein (putative c-di-GMP-specific phosphodiesterase class I)/CheY-like chemotaxis protein
MPADTSTSDSTDMAAAARAATPVAGGRRSPLAVVIDADNTIRQFISLKLQGSGINTIEFPDGKAFRKAQPARSPDLVFLDVNIEIQDAMETIDALGKAEFKGAVQLMSGRGGAVLETVVKAAEQVTLNLLPPLKKPFETAVIQQILSDLKLGRVAPPAEVKIPLAEALKNNWVQFWYQPKIELRKKQLAGVEAFARVCHPQHGALTPGAFMSDASEADILALAELSLVQALKSGLNLSKRGIEMKISINVPVSALVKLSVGDIVRAHRPQVKSWPGLIIDVTEEQIVSEITLAHELNKKLAEHNVRLAIDDFGKGYSALMKLKEMPFAEMKLDPSFVNDCGTDKVHAPICKAVIDLAHSFGSVAVGIGLEKAADAMALANMGCDLGQGFLLGQPMPEERLISLLRQRVRISPAAVSAKSATALSRA